MTLSRNIFCEKEKMCDTEILHYSALISHFHAYLSELLYFRCSIVAVFSYLRNNSLFLKDNTIGMKLYHKKNETTMQISKSWNVQKLSKHFLTILLYEDAFFFWQWYILLSHKKLHSTSSW